MTNCQSLISSHFFYRSVNSLFPASEIMQININSKLNVFGFWTCLVFLGFGKQCSTFLIIFWHFIDQIYTKSLLKRWVWVPEVGSLERWHQMIVNEMGFEGAWLGFKHQSTVVEVFCHACIYQDSMCALATSVNFTEKKSFSSQVPHDRSRVPPFLPLPFFTCPAMPMPSVLCSSIGPSSTEEETE